MLRHILLCLYLKIPENCLHNSEKKKSFNKTTAAQEEKAALHLYAVCLKFSKVVKHGYSSVLSHILTLYKMK